MSMQSPAVTATEFGDQLLSCAECGEDFCWPAGAQQFFFDKGLKNTPKRCPACKQAKNEGMNGAAAAQLTGIKKRINVTVNCAECGEETTVPFYPSQGRPVYCRTCFLSRDDLSSAR